MASLAPTSSFAYTGSFLRDRAPLIELISSADLLPVKGVAGIVAEYVTSKNNPFGAAEWKEHFKIDVSPDIPFGEEFNAFWNGPDPVDVFEKVQNPRLVSETHLPPVLGFQTYRSIQDNTVHARSLHTLNLLGLEFVSEPKALEQHRNKEAGAACLLVMRKDVVARNQTWEAQQQFLKALNAKTGAGYEEKPSVIDMATVILPRKVVNGEYHLGTSVTGAEKRRTYSRCAETVEYDNQNYPLLLGGFHPSYGVEINDDHEFDYANPGIGVLKKFWP